MKRIDLKRAILERVRQAPFESTAELTAFLQTHLGPEVTPTEKDHQIALAVVGQFTTTEDALDAWNRLDTIRSLFDYLRGHPAASAGETEEYLLGLGLDLERLSERVQITPAVHSRFRSVVNRTTDTKGALEEWPREYSRTWGWCYGKSLILPRNLLLFVCMFGPIVAGMLFPPGDEQLGVWLWPAMLGIWGYALTMTLLHERSVNAAQVAIFRQTFGEHAG